MTTRTQTLPFVSDALCDAIALAGRDKLAHVLESFKQGPHYTIGSSDTAVQVAAKRNLLALLETRIERVQKSTPEQLLRYYDLKTIAARLSPEELGKILDQQGISHSSWWAGGRAPHQVLDRLPDNCERDVAVHNGIVALKRRFPVDAPTR